jgi:hypothetical protein
MGLRDASLAHGQTDLRLDEPPADPVTAVLSEAALAALDQRIESVVNRQLKALLPMQVMRMPVSPWLDTSGAASYFGITQNALRLRVRSGSVAANRDAAGRLRFHRDELGRTMRPEPVRRKRR